MTTLAMFPLGSVLLPGEVMTLHVFEPRYRRLVIDCLAGAGTSDGTGDGTGEAAAADFGIVLIERGSEVGGGDVRADGATRARIVRVDPLDGGRFAVIVEGLRRIRVERWLADDPYPRADVSEWPDAPCGDSRDAMDSIQLRLDTVRDLLVATTDFQATAPPLPRIDRDDDVLASFQLGALAPIGPADRYRVLVAPTPEERMNVLHRVLDDAEAALRFRLTDPT